MVRKLQDPVLAQTVDGYRAENAYRIYGLPELHPDAISRAQADAFEARRRIVVAAINNTLTTNTQPAHEARRVDDHRPGFNFKR
jgi:hypothetical protein